MSAVNKLPLLPSLIICLGLGFGVGVVASQHLWTWGSAAPAKKGSTPFLKTKADGDEGSQVATPRDRVVALGRVEPKDGVISISCPIGDRIGSIEVTEGQKVKKGDVLVYLESRRDRALELELAKTQLREATQRRNAVDNHALALIHEAKLHRDQLKPLDDLNIKAQAAKVNALHEQLKNTQTNLDRLQRLRESNSSTVSQQEFEQQSLLVKQAQAELEGAQALLDKLKQGHNLNVASAEANLKSAEAARLRYQQEIPLESAQKSVDLAESRWQHTAIRAPVDGAILRILAQPGEAVGGRPILRLGRTGEMYVIAEVYETDIRHVAEGQAALIKCDALPGAELKGTVEQIGSMIGKNKYVDIDPTATSDARVVEVKIRLDDSKLWEKLINMQVQVSIVCSPKESPVK